MSKTELRPCPFCGKSAARIAQTTKAAWVVPVCVACDSSGPSGSVKEAVAGWNIRPTEDALRAELAAMTADRDSERAWANQYHQEAERLQAELQQARGWIAVSDRLPEVDALNDMDMYYCLVNRDSGVMVSVCGRDGNDNIKFYKPGGWPFNDVTHWRPLPEPPQEV